MQTHVVPNDALLNIQPISIIIILPLIQGQLYPFFNRRKIAFQVISRITVGFLVAALAMAYAALVQHLIYKTGPCYDLPLECAANVGPNEINAWIQSPVYILLAVSSIFMTVAGLEFAYTLAPASMKSLIQAIYVLSGAVGAALGIAISPAAHNPNLVIIYACIAGGMLFTTIVFWKLYAKHNHRT